MHVRVFAMFWWALVLYSVMHLLWSGMILYGFAGSNLGWLISIFVLVMLCAQATYSLRLHTWSDILPYSSAWALSMVTLDAVFSVPLSGWAVYSEPGVLMGYALVVIVPLLCGRLFNREPLV